MIASPAATAAIAAGQTALGIEFGSTRIKAVLIGPDHQPLAIGTHDWENQFVDRIWTYSLDAIREGLQACYASLALDVAQRYDTKLTSLGSIGISAMMHGYLAFDADGELLVPFRTWRNTTTGPASEELTALFGYHIPQRWSIAHLWQAVLGGEEHVARIDHINTLAGYVHELLTGERVLGVGDASGMFPIDPSTCAYHARMLTAFDGLAAEHGLSWKVAEMLPVPLAAGSAAGKLSAAGALLLDPTGTLTAGAQACPPEGDAGTGMVATNSVRPRTGNVSAGTSIFAMVVLERELSRPFEEIDLVTTPAGDLVAMAHCNNGASELNAWAGLFGEFAAALGTPADQGRVFEALFTAALSAAPDAGGLLAYNFLSGEHNIGLAEGRPLFVRTPDSTLSLANFMRAQLSGMLGTLRLGMDVLARDGVEIDSMFGHGGFFKTRGVGQRILAAALDTPVSVGEIAGEGGAWGIALLAAYVREHKPGQLLHEYLAQEVFAGASLETASPLAADVAGFNAFMERFSAGLAVERAAVDTL